ncbi:hypothetical protein LTR08_005256 [Meristemomyces frigidus]|nr:hypothetical protein LTR08_005256 [Meristemomyces frigidus]
MDWPYHFVNLTEAQNHQRRYLLDWYGSLAQISALAPLLVMQCYFLASWVARKRRDRSETETPSSPVAKSERLGKKGRVWNFSATARKVAWWAGDSLDVSGYHLGSKGEVVAAVLWAAWLVSLCIAQTGDDYLHLTKRFGAVASSQLPLQYLLALKTPYSPLQILTRSSHETLNGLHQHLGYITTVLFYLHAALFINLYIVRSLLAAKLQQPYVICGIVGLVAFTAVGTTALSPVRRWSYKVFYMTHVTLATALLPVLFFHVSHIRVYLYETAAIYALSAVLRVTNTHNLPGTITLIPGSSLVEVDVPLLKTADGRYRGKWESGQHAYVSLAGHPFLRTFRSNPFTVASIPTTDNCLKFVARVLDGNTAKLARSAHDRKATTHSISVEGPYGVTTHANRLLGYDRILLVAGGVGATFVVPLYRQLLADLSPSKGSYRRQRVSFLWVARSRADVMWALPADFREREGFLERVSVCLTASTADQAAAADDPGVGGAQEAGPTAYGEPEDGIELEERKTLLSNEPDERSPTGSDALQVKAGRPNIAHIIDQTFSHGAVEKVAVIVCGPRKLGQALRKEVGRYVSRGRDVWFWDESFAL